MAPWSFLNTVTLIIVANSSEAASIHLNVSRINWMFFEKKSVVHVLSTEFLRIDVGQACAAETRAEVDSDVHLCVALV